MNISSFILLICFDLIYGNLEYEYEKIHNNTIREMVTPKEFTSKCFEGLGCFSNGPPFYDPIERPYSQIPSDDPLKRIKFILFTQSENRRSNYSLKLTEDSVRNSNFNSNFKTMVFIHGWKLILPPTDKVFKIKDALFDNTDDYHNFLLVNWTDYTGESMERTVANGRVIGTATAKLVHLIMNVTGASAESFHVVGHSVGAQMTAYVGQQVQGLGRITGLDTGGPQFHHMDKRTRLDASDAKFVDGIHTNGAYSLSKGMGYEDPYADQDFYVNGGETQPGCGHEEADDASKTYQAQVCDHERSVLFFLESITNRNCTFKGTQCDSYADWKAGKCPPSTHPVAVMGLYAKPIPGVDKAKFYLRTRKSKPFCMKNGYVGY